MAIERLSLMTASQPLLPRPSFIFDIAIDNLALDVSAHVSGGLTILEFEPRSGAATNGIATVQSMVARLQTSTDVQTLLDAMASEVQRVTEFDHVMVYRFLEDDSGHVVAECRASPAVDSYLDLHYPASDIPVQARELYRACWIRSIPDATYAPMPLTPANNPKTGEPLDLSYSALRSVSPVHLEYLRNMGVRSSMSLSIIIDDRLWGLIACHGPAPIYLDCRLRGGLELFAQLASLQLRAQLQVAGTVERIEARKIMGELVLAMSSLDLADALIRQSPNLLDFIAAGGVVLRIDGINFGLGQIPADGQIEAITDWLNQTMADGVYATDRLAEIYPPAEAFADRAAGLIALSVSRTPRDYVLWFLPELPRTVTWAGDPTKAVEPSAFGDRLTPRKSFDAWREIVTGRSRPWRAAEIEAATALRVSILEIVLNRIDQIARERDKAFTQQDLLMAELDHRVKNSLATIQAMVRFSGRSAIDLVSYIKAIERRLSSMSQTHSIMTDSRWRGASVRTLVTQELTAYRSATDGLIRLDGDDFFVDARASLSLALVLHELTTNSVKHGSLSVPDGMLSIQWAEIERDGARWLRIDWIERGGPQVQPPTRKGFGRTLLERVFAPEVDGRALLAFDPQGVSCTLEIPFQHVIEAPDGVTARSIEIVGESLPRGSLHGVGVLVFEDNEIFSMELVATLAEEGAIIVGPYNRLKTGIAAALEEPYDIALLDVDLAGKPIWPVARLVRGRDIPIVFSTGYSDSRQRPAEFIETPTIPKPCDATLLVATLARHCLRGPA